MIVMPISNFTAVLYKNPNNKEGAVKTFSLTKLVGTATSPCVGVTITSKGMINAAFNS